MNIISSLFESVKLEDEAIEKLTYGYDTYGKRVEIAKKIIEGGNKKEIHKVLDLVTKTMLKLADAGPHNINSTNTAIAECAQVMVEIGPSAIDPIFKILDKQKNRPSIDLFPQTIQRMCCAALSAIGEPSVLPRFQKYVTYIAPRASDLYVTSHARQAVQALEGAKLLQDLVKQAQGKK
jgi:hypothetical protein